MRRDQTSFILPAYKNKMDKKISAMPVIVSPFNSI
jgi:hypothetical protein